MTITNDFTYGVSALSNDSIGLKASFDDREVTVMSRNLYVGSDLFPLIPAFISGEPNTLINTVSQIWSEVQETNFPERAEAIAEEIETDQPALIGLQEVWLFRTGPPGDPTSAEDVQLDFLNILLEELDDLDLNYKPVAITENSDAESPGFVAPEVLMDIRLTDYDVILARTDLPSWQMSLSNIQEANFINNVQFPFGDTEDIFTLFRGWNSVDVQWMDLEFRFLNSHLESLPAPDSTVFDLNKTIQIAQVNELVAGPLNTEMSVILVGDYNSPAGGLNSESYDILVEAGFNDVWNETHPREPGYTYGHEPDLLNEVPLVLDPQRIDLVMYRGDLMGQNMYRVGEELEDLTPSGLWPSDHAGVVATLALEVTPEGIIAPENLINGVSQDIWADRWYQWNNSTPADENPANFDDNSDPNGIFGSIEKAQGNQDGDVFYLAGSFSTGDPFDIPNRTITIPEDKYLFFPVVNVSWTWGLENGFFENLEGYPSQEPLTADDIRKINTAIIDVVKNPYVRLDGETLYDWFPEDFRQVSPEDSDGDGIPGFTSIKDGNEIAEVAEGYWVGLEPLSLDDHTIEFGGIFELGITNEDSQVIGGIEIDLDCNGLVDTEKDIFLTEVLRSFGTLPLDVTYNIINPTNLDFEGAGLSAGTIITDQFTGLTISADGFGAMIFDTANPTGGDTDLASDNLGNVLILSEDGDSSDPDDNARGGTFYFTWDNLVNVDSIGFLDVEEFGGLITLYGSDDIVLDSFDISNLTNDGGTALVDINLSDVSRMEVNLVASGAITDINFF